MRSINLLLHLYMAKRFDITKIIDTKINCLLVLGEGEVHLTSGGYSHRTIVCRCDCGTIKTFQMSSVLNGAIKSCGCYSAKMAGDRVRKRNTKHGKSTTPEFEIWCAMKKRCLNSNHKSYHMYGGRGISVCDRWINSFSYFLEDMGVRPSSNYSIERVDNNLGYFKENCKWATKKEQCRNVRNNVIFKYNNQSKCVGEWVEILNMSRYKCIRFLMDNGVRL